MDEEQIRQLLQSHRRSGGRPGFRCPDEQRLAAYVDGKLVGNERTSFEKHVSACDSCLDAIAFLARSAEWPEADQVPAYLVARERALAAEKSVAIWRWKWAVATAAAACAVLAITFIVWNSRIRETAAPAEGSLIAQNQQPTPLVIVTPAAEQPGPLPTRSVTKPNLNRGETPSVRGDDSEVRPVLLFPREDSVVRREELEFRWLPGAGAVSYELRLAAADGSLKFARETKDLRLKLGDEVELQDDAHYYVTIVAQSSDGRFTRSEIVSFRLAKN